MQKNGLCLFLTIMLLSFTGVTIAKKAPESAVSTQGYETLSEQDFVNSQPSKVDKNEQKEAKNRLKKQMKLNKKIKKYELQKSKAQKEIKYLEKRLEIQKMKLEVLAPNSMKGEKE
ncbi:MAG: hypothetical protein E7Z87_00080 [Cyanobacteria bacterium SIG26]|nr:hypothetical protein [Cyanobacteria bacterium SIG26]